MLRDLANLAQKTIDLGLGLVSLAADKAMEQLNWLRQQSQGLRSELVEELVKRGQMSREQAMTYVSNLVNQAAKPTDTNGESASSPRTIRIDDDEESPEKGGAIELTEAADLRQQILRLQAELERLRKQT
ncbi:MAG: hypothetical protein Q6K99_00145 [Thermostichales cyanobacterium BF4_bins_65]